jgi:multisubunit Na+/H+ antiporter MnhG subunit
MRAFANGLNEILLIGAGLVLVGALGAVTLVRLRDFHHRPAAAPAAVSEPEAVQA